MIPKKIKIGGQWVDLASFWAAPGELLHLPTKPLAMPGGFPLDPGPSPLQATCKMWNAPTYKVDWSAFEAKSSTLKPGGLDPQVTDALKAYSDSIFSALAVPPAAICTSSGASSSSVMLESLMATAKKFGLLSSPPPSGPTWKDLPSMVPPRRWPGPVADAFRSRAGWRFADLMDERRN